MTGAANAEPSVVFIGEVSLDEYFTAARWPGIADKAYVLVQGANAHTGTGAELMQNDEVRRTFLGG